MVEAAGVQLDKDDLGVFFDTYSRPQFWLQPKASFSARAEAFSEVQFASV